MVLMKRCSIVIRIPNQQPQVRKMVRQLNEYRIEPNIDMIEHVKMVNEKNTKYYL